MPLYEHPKGEFQTRKVRVNEKFSLKGDIGPSKRKIEFQSKYHPLNKGGLGEDFRAKMSRGEAHHDRIMVNPNENEFLDIVTEKKGIGQHETRVARIRFNEDTGNYREIGSDMIGLSPDVDKARNFHKDVIDAVMKSDRIEGILDKLKRKYNK
ncbi:MAG: hypothetical protein J7L23_05450 [Candidatus Diapherotrites archaeon]|nr:hypothetical protein [Candidatus Diapherotrites archaeon]